MLLQNRICVRKNIGETIIERNMNQAASPTLSIGNGDKRIQINEMASLRLLGRNDGFKIIRG